MMHTHEELHAKTLDAAKKEKSATLELLRFLELVEERRTFAVLGYPSLFKYVEEGLGYSPAQASERISAMRLLRQVPEVAVKLSEGAHSLTSIAKLASHVRRENLLPEEAQALVMETSNQTILTLEKHLASVALVEPPKLERSKVISKELTRLTLDVDDEFMATVQRMRELKGNPALSLSEVFTSAMSEFIKKRELKEKEPKAKDSKTKEERSSTSVTEVKTRNQNSNSSTLGSISSESELTNSEKRSEKSGPQRSRYIPMHDRRVVRTRAQDQCEYTHKESGKRCGSRTGLQFEHITPFAKGGVNHEQNLKLYCPAHNRLSAIHAYGAEKMRPYLRN